MLLAKHIMLLKVFSEAPAGADAVTLLPQSDWSVETHCTGALVTASLHRANYHALHFESLT